MILSVIIPTRNRVSLLKNALFSITKQTFPSDQFEVIVVDNGSTDETAEICEEYKSKLPGFQRIYDECPGLHVGRHLGLKHARGEILVYADDDIEAFPTWLEGIAEAFEDKDVALVGGKNLPKFETEPPDWLMKMWLQAHPEGKVLGSLSILDLGDSIKDINPSYVFGCNFSIRKSILLETDGFHPDAMPQELIKYRGDGESYVSRYVLEKGYKTLYHPKVSVYHLVSKERMTSKYFYHRSYIQGISDSFARMRKGHGLDTEHAKRKGQSAASGPEGPTPQREGKEDKDHKFQINGGSICRFLKRGGNSIKNRAVRYKKKLFPTEYDRIRADMQKAHREGFAYHQREIQKDPKLLEWVLRENYLGENGKLPK